MAKSRSETAAVVACYVQSLSKQAIAVDRVYLFGSQLEGTAGELSDIDVIVVSSDFAGKQPWERAEITGKARFETFQATGESVEGLAKTPDEIAGRHPASFLSDVLQQAQIIYERAPAKT